MSAEAGALCNAEYGQVDGERVNHRDGQRPRERDTRAGTVHLAIPGLGSGSCCEAQRTRSFRRLRR
ncbi:transposase [Streptomyces broussonetiae]|uniref:transposase n=1 Tax=Streptomyces broussonetiae TaxID=2686304 RepID=UPI0035DBAE19